MTVEEALVSALEYENRVRDHYNNAAAATGDETGRRVFRALGDEEQGHVDYLESRLEVWRSEGRLDPQKLTSALPPREWLARGKAKMRKRDLKRDYADEIKMLKDALKLEEEVSDHYRRLVAELEGEAQGMFQRFLEIEDGHTAIVRTEIDALEQNNFWFDLQEFNLEAG